MHESLLKSLLICATLVAHSNKVSIYIEFIGDKKAEKERDK